MSDYLSELGDETAGWRRITYTQRGLPPSTTEGPFTVAQHVADVITVLDEVGLDEAVVLGHSWGGFLAAVLATEHPDRVRGMLIIDPMGIVGDGGMEGMVQQLEARTPEDNWKRADELDQRAMAGLGTAEESIESLRLLWPAYFNDRSTATPLPPLQSSVAAYSECLEDATALLAAGGLPERASTYHRPVEVLFGLGSPIPVESSLATAHAFPQGSATGVADAGHFPWIEQPGCVADALVRLASRLD
jgi:pimeloyl-ACP methyl ester carboxylesterase